MERLVRVDQLGLVVPPQKLDCVGEDCPVARKIGYCFVDEHHLYFPRARFVDSELTSRFRNHPYNRISLPRCQHNSSRPNAIHSRYNGVRVPSFAVMERFLEEADLLQLLGVVSTRLDDLLEKMSEEDVPNRIANRRLAAYRRAQATQTKLEQRALAECEVTPVALQRRVSELPHIIGSVLLRAAA